MEILGYASQGWEIYLRCEWREEGAHGRNEDYEFLFHWSKDGVILSKRLCSWRFCCCDLVSCWLGFLRLDCVCLLTFPIGITAALDFFLMLAFILFDSLIMRLVGCRCCSAVCYRVFHDLQVYEEEVR